jgi:hypothetical protein
MASVPVCSLCKGTELVENYFSNKKKNYLTYSMFFILLIEAFSFIVNLFHVPNKKGYDFYSDFVYVLLTQLVLFFIISSIFLWRERLHFCLRKATATMFLSIYYLFGVLSVLFCFSATFYYTVVSGGLLFFAILLFVQSLYAKK